MASLCLSTSCDTFYKILQSLEQIGVTAVGFLVDKEGLKEVKFPFIAQISRSSTFHFVVVNKIIKNKVYIIDSAVGRYKLTLDEFWKTFTGNILEVESYNLKPRSNPRLFGKRELAIIIGSSIIESGLVLASFFLLNNRLYLPLFILIFVIGLLVIIKRCYLLALSKRIDKRLILPLFYKTRDKNKYNELCQFKISRLKNFCELVSHLMAFCLLLILTAFSSLSLFFSALLIMCLSTLLVLINGRKLKRVSLRADTLERDLYVCVDKGRLEEANKSYEESFRCGKKYALANIVQEAIILQVAIISTIAIAAINKKMEVESILFNLLFLVYLARTMKSVASLGIGFDLYMESLGELRIDIATTALDKKRSLGYNLLPEEKGRRSVDDVKKR